MKNKINTKEDVYELVCKVFGKLTESKNIDHLNNILIELNIPDTSLFNVMKYPRLGFSIGKDEINFLENNGLIQNDKLNLEKLNDPSAKLLCAMAWKQGDLLKLSHIIRGIKGQDNTSSPGGLVFYQFGRYLSDPENEPIVDRHVIRAYGIFKCAKNSPELHDWIRYENVRKKDSKYIEEYKLWLKDSLSKELKQCKDYLYHVDKVVFALGKYAYSFRKSISASIQAN